MCLRCIGVRLVRSEPFSPEIEFFNCPACRRDYARRPGHSLTFRWLHPISLVLYDKLFDVNLRDRVKTPQKVAGLPSDPPEVLWQMIEEIELELTHPTQQVRDIVGNPQTEEQCREFLREFVAKARAALREEEGPSR